MGTSIERDMTLADGHRGRDRQTGRRTQTDARTDIQSNLHKDRRMDRSIERYTGEQTNTRAHTQLNTHTDMQSLGVVFLSWPPPSWTMASGCRCNTFSGTRVMDVCGAWQLLLWCLISLTLHMLAEEDIYVAFSCIFTKG